MGKFANTQAEMMESARQAAEFFGEPFDPDTFAMGVGTYLGNPPWRQPGAKNLDHDKSEFEALGLPVPFYRRSEGIRHLRQMGFTDRELMDRIVGRMAMHIERDDSHMALEDALKMGLDVTGCYRLLAVLLTARRPAPIHDPAPPPSSYVDLVEG